MEAEDGIGSCISQLESQASRFTTLEAPKRDEYASRLKRLADEIGYSVVFRQASTAGAAERGSEAVGWRVFCSALIIISLAICAFLAPSYLKSYLLRLVMDQPLQFLLGCLFLGAVLGTIGGIGYRIIRAEEKARSRTS